MTQTITITIDDEAMVTVETKGFTGKACLDATEALEQVLGGKKTSDKKTPEYDVKVVRQAGA